METASSDSENELKSWLKTALKPEHFKDFSVSTLGNSEKGDGYMGDIVFVSVDGITEDKSAKSLNLVLKCSKNSQALRETLPVKEVFFNEIFVYDVIFPYFTQFQKEKGVEDLFNSVPKCYGSFTGENKEVLVLENLKSIGYDLWPKRDTLTRKHIDLVVTEYGKFHATSVAINHQRPAKFQEFVSGLGNILKKFIETGQTEVIFGTPIDESCELLKNDLDEHTLSKWLSLKNDILFVFGDTFVNQDGLKVILHGDCWNNNFMFLHDEGTDKTPSKVAFLDWQVANYGSPIFDLSYFLFACLSEEDLNNLDDILNTYYVSFIHHLELLGMENPETLYPRNQFFDDWKNYSKYGVLMTSLLMKIVSTNKDEVADMGELAESGKSFSETFKSEIRDKDHIRKRIRPIVEYVVKHNLI